MTKHAQIASREILWNVSNPLNQVVMYIIFALSLGVAINGLYWRWKSWTKDSSLDDFISNIKKDFLIKFLEIASQRKTRKDKKAGLFHQLILIGFLALLFTTTMVFIDHDLGIKIYQGNFYLGVTIFSDILGFGLMLGLLLAIARRYISKPEKLHSTSADILMLGLLALMCIQGFLLEGIRISATQDPWAKFSPIGYIISIPFKNINLDFQSNLHFTIWWFHTITVFVFIAYIPYSKFLHIFSSSLSLLNKKIEPKGSLSFPGDIEQIIEDSISKGEDDFKLGISNINDLNSNQLLWLDACTSCGRCQEVCPAYNSEKVLSPKWLILDTKSKFKEVQIGHKENLFKKFDSALLKLEKNLSKVSFRALNELVNSNLPQIDSSKENKIAGEVTSEDVFWSCTTCGACVEQCPVGIDHIDYISNVRRNLVMIEGKIPQEAQDSLRAIETRGNPFGPKEDRINWTKELEVKILNPGDSVDILYWVGCISAYDKRKQKIAESLVKILNASNLSWGILGNKESCTGDPARRIGEENLFQSSAKNNIEKLLEIDFKRIVANCPHCFNTIKNEYPQISKKWSEQNVSVIHHSKLIKELLEENKIKLKKELSEEITFHDPCYLGRHNDSYQEPRDVLIQLGSKKTIEMKENKEKAMCCGAGGGHYWFDMKVGKRINTMRIEQALETKAKIVATGCPFCMQMLEDGSKVKNVEEELQIKDISELVSECL